MPRKRKTPRDELQREPTAPTAAPTAEDWRRTIDLFLILRTLGSAASRRRVEQLAVALEREALDVFRVARQLENGVVPVLDLEERTVTHGRTSIVAKLRDFTRRYVDLAGLDVLDDPVGRRREPRVRKRVGCRCCDAWGPPWRRRPPPLSLQTISSVEPPADHFTPSFRPKNNRW